MDSTFILAATSLGIAAMVCIAAGRAWRGWLDLKRLELAAKGDDPAETEEIGTRIELASVRERLKKLEAIASGVEL
ncbi:MAG: hypothetical protein E6G92_11080 [Alphaproteobacteria bacterium]|nr:MAG: hypothetical protein E6G92_11080 [Alphaproteobacteria bacterium]